MKSRIALFLMAALLLLPSSFAFAADAGDENVVPIYEWHCFMCNKQFFTFQPDSIAGKDSLNNKSTAYQQKAWRLLSDLGKPVPKCEKSPDGAHFFVLASSRNTSPYKVMMRKENYIVLKEGSRGAIKAKMCKIHCLNMGCGRHYVCFKGDDLDMYNHKITDGHRIERYFMKTGSRLTECGAKLWFMDGVLQLPHLFTMDGYFETSSKGLAEHLNQVICSD